MSRQKKLLMPIPYLVIVDVNRPSLLECKELLHYAQNYYYI